MKPWSLRWVYTWTFKGCPGWRSLGGVKVRVSSLVIVFQQWSPHVHRRSQ